MKKIFFTTSVIILSIFLTSCSTKSKQDSTTEEPSITLIGDEVDYGNLDNISNMELTDEQKESINESILAEQEETSQTTQTESSPTETASSTEGKRMSEIEGVESVTIVYTPEELESLLNEDPLFSLDDNNRVYVNNWSDLAKSGLAPKGCYYIKYYIIDYFTHFLGRGVRYVDYVVDSYVDSDTFPYFYYSYNLNGKTVYIRCIYNIANECYYFECPEIGDLKPAK